MKANTPIDKLIYRISDIAPVIGAEFHLVEDPVIEHLLTDSRKLVAPGATLFFALQGPRRDGHLFIGELYRKGVRYFVVSENPDPALFPEAGFLQVLDVLAALQQLATHHRSQFTIPVIGITGSNGKTIVKEWLYQLLHHDFNIVRSPKSYNSQTGVALSVWQMNEAHTLAIFEAGISQQEEMPRLEKMIRPTLGILTNIGEAHSAGFNDDEHKFREKLTLFRRCPLLVGRGEDFKRRFDAREALEMMGDLRVVTWGDSEDENDYVIRLGEKKEHSTELFIGDQSITIPFTDDASIENAITCYCVLHELKIEPAEIAERMKQLQPVNMRLELKKGINHCLVINDSYSADTSSLDIALNFLEQQSTNSRRTVILSDFLQSALPDEELYEQVLSALKKYKITRLIGIGERISAGLQSGLSLAGNDLAIELYPSMEDFLREFRSSRFKEETILVKGARIFAFEQIVQLLEQKAHQTVLEINLNAILHNLKEYQRLLEPTTKIMAMVKAFAYGSGGAEIAGILQYHGIDYLGVAYSDEGVELRKAGIALPVMVMNPEQSAFESIVEHQLEPEIYSFELLQAFDTFLKQEALRDYPVHIELETGMNRLGFPVTDITVLGEALRNSAFKVQSVFSHLAGSEDPEEDNFTMEQYSRFEKAANQLVEQLGYPVLRHIANSAAVARLPSLQMDMVRLGIGLYGVDSTGSGKIKLQPVASLRSTVAQVKKLQAGESVSYNRKGIVERESTIATIRIGYADGYPRRLGNGKGKVWIKNQLAPVIGTVCMDMIMVDITHIPGVREGDDVMIFGEALPVQQLATWADTIPYEIMTGISQRVKRVYYEE